MRCSRRRIIALVATLALGLPARSTEPVVVPRFTHPGAGQTIYLLMPDRFANGSRANDTGGLPGGPEENGFDPTNIGYYHGGDFPGLVGKLDYIKGLNVSAIWTTPPFKNNPVQNGSAGYHGYWITDFLNLDPHFGTNDDYRAFLQGAHARGLRVYLDIVVNHTGDIIRYRDGQYGYVDTKTAPTRDAAGRPFDERAVAFNGLNDPRAFPALSPAGSFPYVPVNPPGREHAKNPAWLNDVTLYHNRGNSTFFGESATLGDFGGLDDLMTEHPQVVSGMIDLFGGWLGQGVDGFRIDTMRHVNSAFWQAFNPAMRAKALSLGRPDFFQFGEVMIDRIDVPYLSEFSTGTMPVDATTDFAFAGAARRFVSQGGPAAALDDFFYRDDYYTDHDSNAHSSVTLLGNYDIGRWGYFLLQDNPGSSREQLADLVRLGHGLLYLVRGMPVLHYGDEQGMMGRGGEDKQAREDMFAAQAPDYRDAPLLGTTRTGKDDKFDPTHSFYRLFAELGRLRRGHVALRTGAMILRPAAGPGLFAFSRLDRDERIEYLAVFNNSRANTVTATIASSQPPGATLARLFDSRTPDDPGTALLTADAHGAVQVTLAPLQFALWRAQAALPVPATAPTVAIVTPAGNTALTIDSHEVDGLVFPSRREIRAEVSGGDGVGEVTFVLARSSRPGQVELLGTDDAAPYRIFWTPPADLAPEEKLAFRATYDDLRGHQAVTEVTGITISPGKTVLGIPGAKNPVLAGLPPARVEVAAGQPLELVIAATGSGSLEYQWYRDDRPIRGATAARYTVSAAAAPDTGRYRVSVHNLAGTTLSLGTEVVVTGGGRLVRHDNFPSAFVPAREIAVWLPPGYDANATERYPVIYLHDGQNIFDPAVGFGGASWEVDRAMCRLIAAGKTKGAILVGVANTGMGRFPEYMPQQAVKHDPVVMLKGATVVPSAMIRSDAYLKFLVEEVKPFIDHTYRTRPEVAHTFVMGSSMGGLISAYALVQYPAVFGGAGCVSTHWPADDGSVVDYVAAHLPAPGTHKLYFDFGTETLDSNYEPYQLKMDAALRANGQLEGRDWLTRKFPGAEHSEAAWRQRVEIPLEFLLGPPAETVRH